MFIGNNYTLKKKVVFQDDFISITNLHKNKL